MAVEETIEDGPAEALLLVTPQPVIAQCATDTVGTLDGHRLVRFCIFTHQGQTVLFFSPNEAESIGRELMDQSTTARTGLILPGAPSVAL